MAKTCKLTTNTNNESEASLLQEKAQALYCHHYTAAPVSDPYTRPTFSIVYYDWQNATWWKGITDQCYQKLLFEPIIDVTKSCRPYINRMFVSFKALYMLEWICNNNIWLMPMTILMMQRKICKK